MTESTLADLERRFRTNAARWRSVDVDVNAPKLDRATINECSEERDSIVRTLERLPITSPAEAVLMMRLALDTVDNMHGACSLDPEEDCDEMRAIRCLHAALCWLETNRADVRRAVITDSMVSAGMEAATTHRHAGAEDRVRAILTAALEVAPDPLADAEFMATQKFEPINLSALNPERWHGLQQAEYTALQLARQALALDDGQLTERVMAEPDTMIEFAEVMQNVAEQSEAHLEVLKAAKARLLVGLSRLQIAEESAA